MPCDLAPLTRDQLQQLGHAFVNHDDTTDAALRNALTVMCASHPTPEQAPPVLRGVTVSAAGWPAVADFQTNTLPLQMLRCFPAGKTLAASLSQVDAAIDRHPGVGVMWSTFMAGRSFTDGQVAEFAQAIRARADRLPWLDIAVDAEPDRKDRSYTVPQFVAGLERLKTAVGPHPKIRWVLNLTGYQFTQRIGAYTAAIPHVDVLAVDPYWKNDLKPDPVQGGRQDVIDAADWAKNAGLAFAFGEWGAQRGANQATNLHLAFDVIDLVRPDRIPYFHDLNNAPGGCSLTADTYPVYAARVAALTT